MARTFNPPGTRRGLLEPVVLHEARDTYVSIMFETGLSLERIGDYVDLGTC